MVILIKDNMKGKLDLKIIRKELMTPMSSLSYSSKNGVALLQELITDLKKLKLDIELNSVF
jgi:hypothetical protein